MTKRKSTSHKKDRLTEKQIQELTNFGPQITDSEVEELERNAGSSARGVQRRLCLLACSRSADVLSNISIESPEAFTEMLECIEAFKEHANGLADMAESAYMRMRVADCREAPEVSHGCK